MKKVIFTAAILVVTSWINLNAQTTVGLGIKANTNLTNVKLSDLEGSKSDFHPGASIGFFSKIGFGEHFALQPELIFNYTESKVKYNAEKIKFKYAGVEVPVYAIGQMNAGTGKFFIGAGPHIGYGFSADSGLEKHTEDISFKDAIELDHWYAGISTMVGYEFDFGLSLHAGYQMSWDLGSRRKSSDIRTQTISLGVAYKFQLGKKR